MRLLPLILIGCASLPEIRPCEPTGAVIDPAFLNLGNDDMLVASMRYQGCEPFDFQLCGIGESWITARGATLGVWHDQTLGGCDTEIEEDVNLSLRSLKSRYVSEFEVPAEILLTIGTHELPYSVINE